MYFLFTLIVLEAFEINQDGLLQLEELDVNLLNNSLQARFDDEDIYPVPRKCRRIVVIKSKETKSEESPAQITRGKLRPLHVHGHY